MAQTRKKAVLQQVRQQRRNRTIASLIVAVVLIAVVVTAAAFLAPKTSLVPLPGYLDQCASSVAYHAHVHLAINISGIPYTVPSGVGIQGGCNRPMHTHATDGVIHVEPNELRDFTLGDFLAIWGNWANDPQFTILNSTQVFNHPRGTVTMTVSSNGVSSPFTGDIKSYTIPRNAGDTAAPCSAQATGGRCIPTNLVITYR